MTRREALTRVGVRAAAVWLVIILAESIHGTLRQIFLAPAIGDFRARQVSVLTGAAIIFVIACLSIRWMRPESVRAALGIGAAWVMLTIVFEVALGRLLGLEWSRIIEDYDLRRGGLMIFGLIAMLFAPPLAARLR